MNNEMIKLKNELIDGSSKFAIYPKEIIMKVISWFGLLLGILILIIYFVNKKNSKNNKQNEILVILSIIISIWLYGISVVNWGRGSYVDWVDPPITQQVKECLIPGIIPFIIQLIIFIKLIINIIKSKKEGGTLNVKNRK